MREFDESVDVLENKYEDFIREYIPNYVELWEKFTALHPESGGGLVPYELETPDGIDNKELRKNLLELHIAAYSLLANLVYAKKQADSVPEKVENNDDFLDAWDKIETIYLRLGNVRQMWGQVWKEVKNLGYDEHIGTQTLNSLKQYLQEIESELYNDDEDNIGGIEDIINRRNVRV